MERISSDETRQMLANSRHGQLMGRIVRLERAILALAAVSTFAPGQPEARADLQAKLRDVARDQGIDWPDG